VRRPPPELVIRLPLEGEGIIVLAAGSLEDERRLREWLRRCRRLDELTGLLLRLLDELDDYDRGAA
jgi:hypothetical protein